MERYFPPELMEIILGFRTGYMMKDYFSKRVLPQVIKHSQQKQWPSYMYCHSGIRGIPIDCRSNLHFLRLYLPMKTTLINIDVTCGQALEMYKRHNRYSNFYMSRLGCGFIEHIPPTTPKRRHHIRCKLKFKPCEKSCTICY